MTELNKFFQTDLVVSYEVLAVGRAHVSGSQPLGAIKLSFDTQTNTKRSNFDFHRIAYVEYFDELLVTPENFPYFQFTPHEAALIHCRESNFLNRFRLYSEAVGTAFEDYQHFVYFDESYCWRFIAKLRT